MAMISSRCSDAQRNCRASECFGRSDIDVLRRGGGGEVYTIMYWYLQGTHGGKKSGEKVDTAARCLKNGPEGPHNWKKQYQHTNPKRGICFPLWTLLFLRWFRDWRGLSRPTTHGLRHKICPTKFAGSCGKNTFQRVSHILLGRGITSAHATRRSLLEGVLRNEHESRRSE